MKPISLLLWSLTWLCLSCGREGEGLSHHLLGSSDPWLVHPSQEEIELGQTTEGSYLVGFKSPDTRLENYSFSNSLPSRRDAIHQIGLMADKSEVQSMALLANLNLSSPKKSFALPRKLSGPELLDWGESNFDDRLSIMKVTFSSKEDADRVLNEWYRQGKIYYAEPNYISQTGGSFEQSVIADFSDSTSFPWLDQISFIEAFEYLDSNEPNSTPIVAVMDSGVDVLHPSLQDNIYTNTQGQNKLCVDDQYGCDTTEGFKDVLGKGTVYPAGTTGFGQACVGEQSNCSHGTHVAGMIAARDFGSSYIGVCPYCSILVVKVVGIKEEGGKESFQIEDSAIIAGLAYVSGFTVNGEPLVRVINASFGKFQRSRSVGLFIESLKNFGKGVLTIAAAGNEDTMKRQYPAAFDDVIAVSNVESSKALPQKSPSSNFGMWVDIAAPGSGEGFPGGGGILSTIPGGGSYCSEGTSMASPIVAGVAGLILATNPNLNTAELRERLLNSALPDNLYQDGVNNTYRPRVDGGTLVPLLGGGVVNAWAAVDQSVQKSDPVFSEKRDVVRPGCGSIGQANASSVFLFLLLPFILLLVRTRD